jgi:hypothetical protein
MLFDFVGILPEDTDKTLISKMTTLALNIISHR